MELPVKYSLLSRKERAAVRNEYIKQQNNLCYYCHSHLEQVPPVHITALEIDWRLFPPDFLKYPIHLQHNHNTDLTEGAVHAYCNAVMWQYERR